MAYSSFPLASHPDLTILLHASLQVEGTVLRCSRDQARAESPGRSAPLTAPTRSLRRHQLLAVRRAWWSGSPSTLHVLSRAVHSHIRRRTCCVLLAGGPKTQTLPIRVWSRSANTAAASERHRKRTEMQHTAAHCADYAGSRTVVLCGFRRSAILPEFVGYRFEVRSSCRSTVHLPPTSHHLAVLTRSSQRRQSAVTTTH